MATGANKCLASGNSSKFGNVDDLKLCYYNCLAFLYEKYSHKTIENFEKKDLITLAYYQGVMGRIDQMATLVGYILGFKNGL